MPLLSFNLIAAEIWLLAIGFVILIVDMFFAPNKKWIHCLSVASMLVAIVWLIANFFLETQGFYGFLATNTWNNSLKILLIIATAICVLLSPPVLEQNKIHSSEFYFLLHVVLVSMLFLTDSLHLFFIYICLETASITSFILCSLNTNNKLAVEGGMKYFLLNAFASAILLYGITLLFGATGSFNLLQIHSSFLAANSVDSIAILGILFLVVGFGFKIALVPFHMWTPDIYASSALTITAFFSTPMKIAFIAIFVKICIVALITYFQLLEWMLGILLVLTLIVANLLALVQKDIKRILAYSSISHAGFLILGILNIPTGGITSLYFYFITYIFASLGVFACLIYLTGKKEVICLDDLTGLGSKHPLVSSIFIFFLFSLAGLPITGGFIAKLILFYNALQAGYLGIVIIGLLASIISTGYYLKLGIQLFSPSMTKINSAQEINIRSQFVLCCCVIVLLVLGIFPSVLDWNIELIQGKLLFSFL